MSRSHVTVREFGELVTLTAAELQRRIRRCPRCFSKAALEIEDEREPTITCLRDRCGERWTISQKTGRIYKDNDPGAMFTLLAFDEARGVNS